MSRTQIQQIVVIVLLIAFGIIWNVSRKTSTLPAATSTGRGVATASVQPSSPPAEPPEAPQSPPEVARDLFRPPSVLQERIQQREAERQPQQPTAPSSVKPKGPESSTVNVSQFQLQGTFWGGTQPQAIINRRIVSVGDKIDGAEVTSILRDRVLLNISGVGVELKPLATRTLEPQQNTE